ncbi:MAG: hypothetical protein M1821_004439 [Bathelium mastoideum]|nr:MAG: hypothetical protein M1821_004439 [Bathelium mastoideum]
MYGSVPQPNEGHLSKGYGSGSNADSAYMSGGVHHDYGAGQRESSIMAGEDAAGIQRSASRASNTGTPSRSGTLKKKNSVKRVSSLKRSGSRRSMKAGSIKGFGDSTSDNDFNSVFHTPIPTSGTPTDILANRFQAWRKMLKDLITYFREIQASYEQRAKSLLKVSNVINNTNAPSLFMTDGGLNDAMRILRDHHKHAVMEANKAKDIENDVITQLSGLRSDLNQKIKEIKSLSGDFKNSVDKERDSTRKAVNALTDALDTSDQDPSAAAGKGDPYVVRLAVDRQVEKQIDEENYLHRAYLNLEGSGRELESIVVGEIQKAYNAYAGILRREADDAYEMVDALRNGPIGMPKDFEWSNFVENDPHFVDPSVPLRRIEDIDYPGKNHPGAAEVRAGMLERKSKYLKSYTPGWYVLSPTHLHEFKSADRIYSQPPVMSLYLPDQKLGSRSQDGSSSHKFMLKGRQTGSMHRGHSWVFRAETYDTMMAWYDDIKNLTEKTGEERNAFVRRHARSISANSQKAMTISSDGLEEDEADAVPYSANASSVNAAPPLEQPRPQRPQPGGRFPSDVQVNHNNLQSPAPASSASSDNEHELIAAAGVTPGGTILRHGQNDSNRGMQDKSREVNPYELSPTIPTKSRDTDTVSIQPSVHGPEPTQTYKLPPQEAASNPNLQPTAPSQTQEQPQTTQSFLGGRPDSDTAPHPDPVRHNSLYGDWMAPAAGGAAAGAVGAEAYNKHQLDQKPQHLQPDTRPHVEPNDADSEHPIPIPPKSPKRSLDQLRDSPSPEAVDGAGGILGTAGGVAVAHGAAAGHKQPQMVAEKVSETPLADAQTPDSQVPTSPPPVSKVNELEEKSADATGSSTPRAQQTGRIFPKVLRHNTDVTVSDLHIPGEFPSGQQV